MSDLKELLSGISPQHAQNYPISKCALCDFSLIISHLLGTLARLHKKKSLYNPESIGILKSPWPQVTLHSVYQILMLTYDSCFTVKLHVHSYFCLEEISDRVFKTSQTLIMLTNMFILKVVLFLQISLSS